MSNCYADLLFLLPFNSLIVLVLFQFPGEVSNDLDFLPLVDAGLVQRMDDVLHDLIQKPFVGNCVGYIVLREDPVKFRI